jgi:hypothetical protein
MTNQTRNTIVAAARRRWTVLVDWIDDCAGAIIALGAGADASGDASFEVVLLFSLLGLTVSLALFRFLSFDVTSLALSAFK